MTVPLSAYLVTFKFTLKRVSTAEDIAEFGLWFQGIDAAVYDDSELIHVASGASKAWTDNVNQNKYCSNVVFQGTVATNYSADGHILHEQEFASDAGWVGTADPPALPWETSLCISLYTYPRGTFVPQSKRKRGRYYLPPMAASQLDGSNSGYFLDSAIAAALDEQHSFLSDAQNTELGVPVGNLSVFSRVDGAVRHVSQISCDAKFDSQRRRENREEAGVITSSFG